MLSIEAWSYLFYSLLLLGSVIYLLWEHAAYSTTEPNDTVIVFKWIAIVIILLAIIIVPIAIMRYVKDKYGQKWMKWASLFMVLGLMVLVGAVLSTIFVIYVNLSFPNKSNMEPSTAWFYNVALVYLVVVIGLVPIGLQALGAFFGSSYNYDRPPPPKKTIYITTRDK